MYDRAATETSKGALVELCRALRQYRSDMVLAGGWVPYFLVKDYFDHCGSIDMTFNSLCLGFFHASAAPPR
jgi:hypothetical protein